MADIEVRLTIKCVVPTLDEAYDAFRNAAKGCEETGWEIAHGELRAEPASEEIDSTP